MNGELVDRQIKIDFFAQDNKLNARLTPQQLERWGIDTNKLSVSSPSAYQQNIAYIIQGATEKFDANNQKLILNIPQSYLKPQDWLSTPPHLWDEGMPALMVNYLFNGIKQNNNGYGSRSQFYLWTVLWTLVDGAFAITVTGQQTHIIKRATGNPLVFIYSMIILSCREGNLL